MHIYRWDLDKTYLATDIHSVRGLIRTAMERASDKHNVPGSAALLRGLIHWDPACRVAILSGSPTQMRAVLEEKLSLDGIRFDSLVLKDNVGNLRRGRFRAIRGQMGYKLPSLLKGRVGLGAGVSETLFGDDTEVDALVYTVYAEAVAGRIEPDEVARIMEAAGAYSDTVDAALRALRHVGRAEAVEDIFIRVDRGIPIRAFRQLGGRVTPVFSWFQAALSLWDRGRLGAGGVVDVARACMAEATLDETALAALVQDALRRHLVSVEAVQRLLDEATDLAPVAPTILRAVRRLGTPPEPQALPKTPQYMAFLREAE